MCKHTEITFKLNFVCTCPSHLLFFPQHYNYTGAPPSLNFPNCIFFRYLDLPSVYISITRGLYCGLVPRLMARITCEIRPGLLPPFFLASNYMCNARMRRREKAWELLYCTLFRLPVCVACITAWTPLKKTVLTEPVGNFAFYYNKSKDAFLRV